MFRLYKYRYPIVLLIILAVLLAASYLPSLTVNNEFTQFLAANDPEYAYYKNVSTELEDDTNLLYLGLTNEPDIYDPHFLDRAEALMLNLDTITQLKSVNGLSRSKYPTRSMLGIITVPYLNFEEGDPPFELKQKIERDAFYANTFTNSKRTALLIYLELRKNLSQEEIESALNSISIVINEWPNESVYLWGKHYVASSLSKVTKTEMTKNLGLGFLFLGIVLFLILRKWQAVLVIFGAILGIITIYYGLMAAFGLTTNLMTNLLPTIILISGVSDIIHLSVRAQKGFEAGKSIPLIYSATLKEVGRAIFVTSATTALGFFSLLLSPIPVLQQFGLLAGIAVLLTFLLIVLIFPAVLSYKGQHLLELRPFFIKHSLGLINNLGLKSKGYPGRIVTIILLIVVLSVYGILNINTNNKQYSMPDTGQLIRNHDFFEKEFGGSRTVELYVQSKEGKSLLQPDLFNTLNALQSSLDNLPYLNRVSSPLSLYSLVHRGYHLGDNPREFTEEEIRRYTGFLNRWPSSRYLLSQDRSLFKYRGQMKDLGRNIAEANYLEIESEARKLLDTSALEVRVNGLEYLYDRTHSERIRNMLIGIFIAIIIVTIVLGYLFKNIALAAMALLLNIIPIIIGAGVMGLTSFELRAGTSIIFTVAFVIAVDDTIHLLSKYLWERKRGANVENALQAALSQCGSAILATSIILSAAFLALTFSSLTEIAAFGFLTAVMLILAFFADILLLPILIRKRNK